jgi:hypothetical protein
MPSSACPHVLAPGDVPAREPGGRVPPYGEQTLSGLFSFPPRQGGDQGAPGAATHSHALGAHKTKRPSGRGSAPAVLGGARSAGFTAGAPSEPGLTRRRRQGSPPANRAQCAHSLSNPVNYTDPSGMWACRGNDNCKAWVENALNMLAASGETGQRLVDFFYRYDAQVKRTQGAAYLAYTSSPYYYGGLNFDCSQIAPGVTIEFADNLTGRWGFTLQATVMELANQQEIINGPVPPAFGVIIFGHEISHWSQGIQRITVQGEVLAQYVEHQLRNDFGNPPSPNTGLNSDLVNFNPFTDDGLKGAARYLVQSGSQFYLFDPPRFGDGLQPSWLTDLAVPLPPPPPLRPQYPTPVPPARQNPPGPQPVPVPPGTPGPTGN